MSYLVLECHEPNQSKRNATIDTNPVLVGRDPTRCQLVFNDPTVSSIHVEIFFNQHRRLYYLKTIKDKNRPIINHNKYLNIGEEFPLSIGSQIKLGNTELKVIDLNLGTTVPETKVVAPPPPPPPPPPPNDHPQLTIECLEPDKPPRREVIITTQPTKNPGLFRLGRNQDQCDIIFQDKTVSGLHLEIYFQSLQQVFYLKNKTAKNLPWINDRPIGLDQQVVLEEKMEIKLGTTKLTIIRIDGVLEKTITPEDPPPPKQLICLNPQCRKVADYDRLQIGCPYCGWSLSGSPSIKI